MKVGTFEVNILHDGYFKLDGGAMFGVVPKVIWDRLEPSDDRNRIRLASNPALIRTDEHIVLIDTGVGSKYDPKGLDIYEIEMPRGLISELLRLEVNPDSVTHVINTHLHFDHVGGNTYKDFDGVLKPTFANARYFIQKGEYEDAMNPTARTHASYNHDDIVPLQESEQINLIDGDTEIVPGIKVRVTGGHTKSHSIGEIESEGEKAIYLADLIPTSSHIRVPYVMGYDLYPTETVDYKKALLEEAADGNYLLIFEHSPHNKVGRVYRDGESYHFDPEPFD